MPKTKSYNKENSAYSNSLYDNDARYIHAILIAEKSGNNLLISIALDSYNKFLDENSNDLLLLDSGDGLFTVVFFERVAFLQSLQNLEDESLKEKAGVATQKIIELLQKDKIDDSISG